MAVGELGGEEEGVRENFTDLVLGGGWDVDLRWRGGRAVRAVVGLAGKAARGVSIPVGW